MFPVRGFNLTNHWFFPLHFVQPTLITNESPQVKTMGWFTLPFSGASLNSNLFRSKCFCSTDNHLLKFTSCPIYSLLLYKLRRDSVSGIEMPGLLWMFIQVQSHWPFCKWTSYLQLFTAHHVHANHALRIYTNHIPHSFKCSFITQSLDE